MNSCSRSRVPRQGLDCNFCGILVTGFRGATGHCRQPRRRVGAQGVIGADYVARSLGTVFVGSIEGAEKMLSEAMPVKKADANYQQIAQRVVQAFKTDKRIVPGVGHLFHKPIDPRTPRLFEIAKETGFDGPYLQLMLAVSEEAARGSGKVLPVNATGAIGALCCEMGFDWKDMAKFNVRSNCISPFAWSRMIGSIPTETDEQKARVERRQRMETSKIAPLAVYLASDEAADVSGQIFAVRANEIFLMSQSRPLRSMHSSDGWTPQTVASRVMPAMKPSFYRLDRSQDVFDWDPV